MTGSVLNVHDGSLFDHIPSGIPCRREMLELMGGEYADMARTEYGEK